MISGATAVVDEEESLDEVGFGAVDVGSPVEGAVAEESDDEEDDDDDDVVVDSDMVTSLSTESC